jgi:hypothetical protein
VGIDGLKSAKYYRLVFLRGMSLNDDCSVWVQQGKEKRRRTLGICVLKEDQEIK